MLQIAIIGHGYWGKNLVRNFYSISNAKLHTVADANADRLKTIPQNYPTVKVTTNINEVIQNPEIHAVAIATPVSTQYELAKKCLQAGKHVLVEKPMTSTYAQAQELIEIAEN
ncbi:MAG: Gfo/Idh/MocA family oxidoreductase, partial [Microscillaceae bacterium]|nr:Gfo/Idh/MocA family oxidoreductase [Microscillaceae bacterium]MDW8460621.1 Gfo/Idh/MocA family oxidoreductase [Cytophagales bacterium]